MPQSLSTSPSFRRDGVCLHRVITVFGNNEFETIAAYCKRKRMSLYALAKASIREYVKRHR